MIRVPVIMYSAHRDRNAVFQLKRRTFLPAEVNIIYQHLGHL